MDYSKYQRLDAEALMAWRTRWDTPRARTDAYAAALKVLRLNAEAWARWAAEARPMTDVPGLVAQYPAISWAELLLGEAEVLSVVLRELVDAGQVAGVLAHGAPATPDFLFDSIQTMVADRLRPLGVCVEDMGTHWAFFLPE